MTANQVQIRRDSATNLNAATPALGELGYDSTNKQLRVGDGTTAGGIRLPNSVALQNQSFIAAAASGTDTITLTVSPVPTAYATYQRFVFKAAADNTATATLNVNSLGAKTIKKRTTSGIADLSAGDIQQDGVYAVVYDGTYFQLEDATPSSVTSDFVYLGSATASASATLDFASLITSTYDTYMFVLKDLRPATDGAGLRMRTSTNNGSSYDSGAANYAFSSTARGIGASAVTEVLDTTSTSLVLNSSAATATGSGVPACGNAAAEGASGLVWLVSPLNATRNKMIKFDIHGQNSAGIDWQISGFGIRDSTADIDAVRFLMSSGNITSGTIDMYGLRA